jgi:hypothetical protein
MSLGEVDAESYTYTHTQVWCNQQHVFNCKPVCNAPNDSNQKMEIHYLIVEEMISKFGIISFVPVDSELYLDTHY